MKKVSIAYLRREYRHKALVEKNAPKNPLALFEQWFKDALKAQVLDANAMAITSVAGSGKPSSRIVLLKEMDRKGFVFFTNYESQKGRELKKNPFASLLFYWAPLSRQVRIEGKISKVSPKESDAYFKTRPRGSQLGAWASYQSHVIPNRPFLENRMQALEEQFAGRDIPRPSHWGGYRLVPSILEFWQGQPNRLHDRLQYQKKGAGWRMTRLAP